MKARKIRNTGTLKNIGKFPSLKNRSAVWFESLLERDFIYLIEYDKEVIKYQEQPFKIQYFVDGKRHTYTPDFLIEKKDKKLIVEVKPQSKVESEEFTYFSNQIKTTLAKENYDYFVITDLIIRRQPRLSNIKLLFRYARIPITTRHQILIHELFNSLSSISLSEFYSFLTQSKEQKELVYALLFHGYLLADIEKPINEDSVISAGSFN